MRNVTALVGAQFGSEGKGLIASKIAHDFDIHVRTGGPNAGHTYFVDGQKIVARAVPCGACNLDATLVIGAGAFLDFDQLMVEIRELRDAGLDVADRLFVDRQAALVDPIRHYGFEGGVEGDADQMIGSTGHGVGPARMAKLARGTLPKSLAWAKLSHVAEYQDILFSVGVGVVDTALLLNDQIDRGASVLLEGTQGSGLSLTHGVWPYVTSHDTNAAELAADAGISPMYVDDVMLVARAHPIRVAGNSGPLPNETTWEKLEQEPEQTTVTKKTRRVGEWSTDLVKRAVMLNRPSAVAVTFVDYNFPEDRDVEFWSELSLGARVWIRQLEDELGVDVTVVGTGPDSVAHNTGLDRVVASARARNEESNEWPLFDHAYHGAVQS